ncbi:VOC family protein [Reyranella sp.]|uniref:VOC family protein n=1 Tax=Reyranella sp. TaxID=1929291 RepID=UPI003C79BBC8
MLRTFLALLLVFVAVAPASAEPAVQGLDHIPVVVKDLERARSDFEALGFVLKRGRVHANGLRNHHAKFADGTEIELITPSAAADALTTQYVDWLKTGDGPVSLGLYRPGSQGEGPPGLFFDNRQHSPTDRPEHFAHPNGAQTLSAVWLAGSPAEPQILDLPSGKLVAEERCAPFGSSTRLLALKEGEIVFLPASAQLVPGRPIVAATLTVKDLAETRRTLTANGVAVREAEACARKSLWVETHGLWLEFRQR